MRSKPYSATGIKRKRCFRCGEKAHAQWTVCSLGNGYSPICKACDIELNRLTIEFMRVENVGAVMAAYEAKVLGP